MCNFMLGIYGQHGQGVKAHELFNGMSQHDIRPNEVTFSCLLNAYSHAGMVDEALEVFESMEGQYNIISFKF